MFGYKLPQKQKTEAILNDSGFRVFADTVWYDVTVACKPDDQYTETAAYKYSCYCYCSKILSIDMEKRSLHVLF